MSHDAGELLDDANAARQAPTNHVRAVADWFHDHEGDLFTRNEAILEVSDALDLDHELAARTIINLLDDHVDPVVQVPVGNDRYVGVIDYDEHDFWYSYTDYIDTMGDLPKGVCAACVHEADHVDEVAYAMPGHGSLDLDAGYDEIEAVLTEHFKEAHANVAPDDVETGASLVSGTTISGNTAIHLGNDGPGSGVDAETVDGSHAGDLAPSYSDGTTNCYIVKQMRFGAEGSSTSSTAWTVIGNSDITMNPADYRDTNGNLYCRFYAHLKHWNNSGTVYSRMYRQNAGTAVTGTQVSVTANDGWGIADSGWTGFGDSGHESYHVQLNSSDGEPVEYNSIVLQLGVLV